MLRGTDRVGTERTSFWAGVKGTGKNFNSNKGADQQKKVKGRGKMKGIRILVQEQKGEKYWCKGEKPYRVKVHNSLGTSRRKGGRVVENEG